jgi:CheY-like chemotaxis protein
VAEFRSNPRQFDLVIVDHLMPDMTGIEFARALRRLRDDVPIVLMSGYTGPLLIQEALAAGIDRILMKPLELESLAQTIASVRANAPSH